MREDMDIITEEVVETFPLTCSFENIERRILLGKFIDSGDVAY